MRTETKEIKIYRYEELDKEAKERVLEYFRNVYDLYNMLLKENCDYYKEQYQERYGMYKEDTEINYDLSCCQGSGASFTCKCFSEEKLFKALSAEGYINKKECRTALYFSNAGCLSVEIYRNSHNYTHSETVTVSVDCEYGSGVLNSNEENNLQEIGEILEKAITSLKNDLCRELYNKLYNALKYYQSEESILDTINSNDYEFTEEGKIY